MAPALASPLPILHPKKCPAHTQCQCIYLHRALRWRGGGGVPKVPNYNSQSPPGPRRGGTSWFSPTLADSPCIPVSSLPGQRLPASTHPAITPLPKRCQVVHCFQSQHPTPYSQSWLFSSQGERTVPPRDFPRTPSFSAIICPLLKKVCLDLAALSNRTFCGERDVLYLHSPTISHR